MSCRSRPYDNSGCRHLCSPVIFNRQLPALHSAVGRPKAEILAERFRDINPDLELTVLVEYLKDERIPELLDSAKFDFVVDAIDTVAPKCYLIYNVLQRRLPIVSSMGAGAKWILLRFVLPIYGILTIAD